MTTVGALLLGARSTASRGCRCRRCRDLLTLLLARGRLPEVRLVDRRGADLRVIRGAPRPGAPSAVAAARFGAGRAAGTAAARPMPSSRRALDAARGPGAHRHRHLDSARARPTLIPDRTSGHEPRACSQCARLLAEVREEGASGGGVPREAEDPQRSVASGAGSGSVRSGCSRELADPAALLGSRASLLLACRASSWFMTVHLLPPFSATGWCGR